MSSQWPYAGLLADGQALTDLVAEPPVELAQAGGYPGLPLLRASSRGLGVFGVAWFPGLRAAGPAGASGEPAGGPVRRLAGVVLHRLLGPEQQQGQRVLARELPARAGAPIRGAGQVDDGVVRRGGAAAALAPQHPRLGGAGQRPRAARRQRLGGPLRRRVGRQGKHSRAIPAFGHGRNPNPWY